MKSEVKRKIIGKEIELEELPDAEEFIKNVKICDDLSKKTLKEHGFKFCKQNDKIIVDKICSGTDCTLKYEYPKCHKYDDSFHTHVIISDDKQPSTNSIADLYHSAYNSYLSNRANISCVKSTTDRLVLCDKIHIKNREMLLKIKSIKENFYKKPVPTYEEESKFIEQIYDITKTKSALIHTLRIIK